MHCTTEKQIITTANEEKPKICYSDLLRIIQQDGKIVQ